MLKLEECRNASFIITLNPCPYPRSLERRSGGLWCGSPWTRCGGVSGRHVGMQQLQAAKRQKKCFTFHEVQLVPSKCRVFMVSSYIYIYIFRHILGAVFSATHAAWLQKYHGRQVLNCWKLMGKQDLELNRWEMVKVDWVGECTIEFSKTCDGCTTCIWRGPYIQGMRQEAHVILYQQTTKIAGNIHGHAKMVVKIQKRRWLLAWCCAVQRCCATPRSFAWPSVKEIVLGCWDFGWGPGQRVYICIDYLCVVLYGVDRSSNIPCV